MNQPISGSLTNTSRSTTRCTRNAGATPNEIRSASESNSLPNGLSAPPHRAHAPVEQIKNAGQQDERERQLDLLREIRGHRDAPRQFSSAPQSRRTDCPPSAGSAENKFSAGSPRRRAAVWEWIRSCSVKGGNHRFAANHPVAEIDADFRAQRQINVHARAELNEADAVAALDRVVLGDPRHDAARNQPGDEPDADFLAGRLAGVEADEHVFVELRAVGFHRVQILAGRVLEKRDAARHRRVLNVNVEHGKKYRDAPAFAPDEIRLGRRVNHVHLAVAGRDDKILAGRHHRVGIAEKIQGESGEKHPERNQNPDQIMQHEFADDLAQERGGQQRQQCRQRKTSDFQRGERGFSRVFHAAMIKLSRATCNSAFSVQVGFHCAKVGRWGERPREPAAPPKAGGAHGVARPTGESAAD